MRRLPLLIFSVACVNFSEVLAREGADPFAFFRPSVIMTDEDRQRLDSGGTVARVVPGGRHAVAVFSATQDAATSPGER